MAAPRHPGSRVVPHSPDLVRIVKEIQANLKRIRDTVRPETLTFVAADPATGAPVTAAALTDTHVTQVYRAGDGVYADVLVNAGASSVVEVALAVPALGATGTAVASAAGGEQVLRVGLVMPSGWQYGQGRLVRLRARRVSGSDTGRVRVLRAWQR